METVNDGRLTTERLILRPYRKEDADDVFKVVSRKEIAQTTLMIPHPYPRENVDWWFRYMDDCRARETAFEFGLFLKDSGEYTGNCGLLGVSKEHSNAELGYFINPDLWNRGYGTEACRRVIRYGFETLGLERIYGRCMAKNIGSRRILEKAGLLLEGIARHEVCKWGQFEDTCRFGVIRSEWGEPRSPAGIADHAGYHLNSG